MILSIKKKKSKPRKSPSPDAVKMGILISEDGDSPSMGIIIYHIFPLYGGLLTSTSGKSVVINDSRNFLTGSGCPTRRIYCGFFILTVVFSASSLCT